IRSQRRPAPVGQARRLLRHRRHRLRDRPVHQSLPRQRSAPKQLERRMAEVDPARPQVGGRAAAAAAPTALRRRHRRPSRHAHRRRLHQLIRGGPVRIMNTTDHNTWLAEAQAEAIAYRLEAVLSRRPAAFADPGALRGDARASTARSPDGSHGSRTPTGEIGTTKTWHLWKLNETLIRRGWRGTFRIATTYDIKLATDRPVDHERLASWRDADLYAIDDLGARAVNDWTADAISELIDARWQNRRPTLIATNLTTPEIRTVLGDRTASRIGDGTTVAQFTGADRRKGNTK